MMRRLGFLVNPIAGMGGSVGLKGTDGMVEEARRRGARPVAPERARIFARRLDKRFELFTCDPPMGQQALEDGNRSVSVVYTPAVPTTAADTVRGARALREAGVDLLVFVGGDGTARDVLEAIGQAIPVLGVPAGVKMYSAVFAYTPGHAAEVVNSLGEEPCFEEREVVDIDEEKFRRDQLGVSVKGYLLCPVHHHLQPSKGFGLGGEEAKRALAERVVEDMQPGVVYVLGGGSTIGAVKEALGIEGSLLGVDVVRDGRLLCTDASADDIRGCLGQRNAIIVSPLGGHGFLFGRGNEQITPDIIRRVGTDCITVIAAPEKLAGLGSLKVDTGDENLDAQLRGFVRVLTGHGESKLMRVE